MQNPDYTDPEFPNDDPESEEPRKGDTVGPETIVNHYGGGQWHPTEYDRRQEALNKAISVHHGVRNGFAKEDSGQILGTAKLFLEFLSGD